MICKVQLQNYKSVQDQTVNLSPLNVLVGKNAAGRSVLFSALFFLHQLATYGLEDAVRYQRGWLSLVNQLVLKENRNGHTTLRLAITTDTFTDDENGTTTVWPPSIQGTVTYIFEADFTTPSSDQFSFADTTFGPSEIRETLRIPIASSKNLKNPTVMLTQAVPYDQGYPQWDDAWARWDDPQNVLTEIQRPFLEFLTSRSASFPTTVMRTLLGRSMLITPMFYEAVRSMAWYDFQPFVIRQAVPPDLLTVNDRWGWATTHKIDLIARSSQNYRQFLDLLKEIVPVITDFQAKSLEDRSLLLWATETFSKTRMRTVAAQLPASSLSDGTLYAAALINALHFEFQAIKMIEEPEQYLHPGVFPIIAQWAQNVADPFHRVLLSTHNSDFLAVLPLETIIHVRRNSQGFTEFHRLCQQASDELQDVIADLTDIRGYQRMDAWA